MNVTLIATRQLSDELKEKFLQSSLATNYFGKATKKLLCQMDVKNIQGTNDCAGG